MTGLLLTVTDPGRAALVNAQHNGTAPVTIASIGVTSTAFVPSTAQTVLAGEIKRLVTIAGGATAADTIHVTIKDDSADTYSLRGLGAYLADGTLFAVFGQADVLLEKSAQATMLLACDWQFADIDAASLTFGDTNFQLNAATTEVQGIVELATDAETITGTDAQRAVTPHGLVAKLTDLLGAGAPSAFVKSLLAAATALAFRTALAIKGAALYDTGTGNGLDADLLDGQHGAYYRSYANLTGVPATFAPAPHTHPMSDVVGLTAALATYAPLASPALTGTPTAPTPAAANNTTQVATTAFVQQVIANVINGAPGALDTLRELADAMGDDPNFAATVTNALAGKAALSGAVFTGPISVPGNVTFTTASGATPAKHMRSDGASLQITNNADSAYIFTLTDAGSLAVAGSMTAAASFNSSTAYWVGATANGLGAMLFRPNGPASTVGQMELDPTGYLYVAGQVMATGGFQVSDRRFKHDIAVRAVDTSIASQLAPLWSQWNRNSDEGFDTGLIAQDVLRIAPQFVHVPDDPEDMLAIDKAGIALECALGADIRITQLLARIEALEQAA